METLDIERSVADQTDAWEQLEKSVRGRAKSWRELRDALAASDLTRALKTLSALDKEAPLALPDGAGTEAVRDWCRREEKARPLRLGKQLREAAEAAGVACQPLGGEPPTFSLAPFTVEFDFKKGEAVLSYARMEAGRVPLDASRILAERARLAASLETEFDAAEYLKMLINAYRRQLISAGLSWGERVDLVDVLPELAFLQQSERFRKDPNKEAFKPYGKLRFAYDLARLRRSRQLELGGARLQLGTATLGSTRNKDRVMFLEEAGQGQFYLSVSFSGSAPR